MPFRNRRSSPNALMVVIPLSASEKYWWMGDRLIDSYRLRSRDDSMYSVHTR